MIEINKLKKDDFFKLSEEGKTVYVYKGYNRMTKKYYASKFDDISAYREWKKGKKVFVDFEF